MASAHLLDPINNKMKYIVAIILIVSAYNLGREVDKEHVPKTAEFFFNTANPNFMPQSFYEECRAKHGIWHMYHIQDGGFTHECLGVASSTYPY